MSELRFMGTASTATRAEMDALAEASKGAVAALEGAKREQERLAKHLIGVRAGLAHLQEMLQVRPTGGPAAPLLSSLTTDHARAPRP